MWHHTVDKHSGTIGPNRGIMDYKFVVTGTFKSNFERLVDEGRRQTIFEDYQSRRVLTVLNSKIDFIQPMRAKLTSITNNINYRPGQISTTNTKYPPQQPQPQQQQIDNRKPLKGKRRILSSNKMSTPTKQARQQRPVTFSDISPITVHQHSVKNLHNSRMKFLDENQNPSSPKRKKIRFML